MWKRNRYNKSDSYAEFKESRKNKVAYVVVTSSDMSTEYFVNKQPYFDYYPKAEFRKLLVKAILKKLLRTTSCRRKQSGKTETD